MRVTNRMLERSMIQNISAGLERVADAQERVATGIRLRRASDDPQAAAAVMRIDHGLRALEQFRRHTGAARARLHAEDSVLEQVQDLLSRAKELAIAASDSTATSGSLAASAVELDQILNQVYQVGNTRIGNEYIFAGSATTTPPFQGGVYVGDSFARQVEISEGVITDTSHTGDAAFVNSNVINGLSTVLTAMQSGNPTQVRNVITEIDTALRNTQTLQAEVGARSSRLDFTEIYHTDLDADLTEQRSDHADADFEKATTEFLTAQTVLEAARASASHVLRTVLTEFLR